MAFPFISLPALEAGWTETQSSFREEVRILALPVQPFVVEMGLAPVELIQRVRRQRQEMAAERGVKPAQGAEPDIGAFFGASDQRGGNPGLGGELLAIQTKAYPQTAQTLLRRPRGEVPRRRLPVHERRPHGVGAVRYFSHRIDTFDPAELFPGEPGSALFC